MMEQVIQQTAVARFGKTHRLSHILTLNDLDLKHFPITATGKVKKHVLRNTVEAFLSERSTAAAALIQPSSTLTIVLALWRNLLTGESCGVTQRTSVTTLADS